MWSQLTGSCDSPGPQNCIKYPVAPFDTVQTLALQSIAGRIIFIVTPVCDNVTILLAALKWYP